MKSFFYIIRLFYFIDRRSLVLFILCHLIGVPLLLGELFYTKYFVDTIQSWDESLNSSSIYVNMVILIGIILIGGILSSLKALSKTHLEEASLYKKEELIINKTLKLTMIELDSPNTKSHREKAMRLKLHTLLDKWILLFSDGLKIGVLISILIYLRLSILVFLIIIFNILQLIVNKYSSTKVEKIYQKQTSSKRLTKYLFNLFTSRENIQEISLLKIHDYIKTKLEKIMEDNLINMQKAIFKGERMKALFKLFNIVLNIIVTILLVLTVAGDIKGGGQFVLLYQIVNNLFSLGSSISTHFHDITQYNINYDDFISYLDKEEDILSYEDSRDNNDGVDIQINKLVFRYPDTDFNALNGINIDIKSGEKVAFIGENGSGKSTLVKIIMGLYRQEEGSINWYLNGEVIPYYLIGNKVRVVFQDFAKLLRPIRENIALGNISKINNESELSLALDKADISSFSKDLDELIGPQFGGIDISGGQWQRLAYTRTLLEEGSLLIYDEATSALDPQAEVEAFNFFLSIAKKKTAIFVTHRLSMTKFVDKIAIIGNGKILEYGSHDELLKQDSIYAKMYNLQSTLYRD